MGVGGAVLEEERVAAMLAGSALDESAMVFYFCEKWKWKVEVD